MQKQKKSFMDFENALLKFLRCAFFCSPRKKLRSTEERKRDCAPFVSSPVINEHGHLNEMGKSFNAKVSLSLLR